MSRRLTESEDEAWVDALVAMTARPDEELTSSAAEELSALIEEADNRGDPDACAALLIRRGTSRLSDRDAGGAQSDFARALEVINEIAGAVSLEVEVRSQLLELAFAGGDVAAAEGHAERLLQIHEDLAERVGGPQELRDLSISLNNVGRVQEARGDWTGAETSHTRSLQIHEDLAERVGGPQELRDLSISLNNVGRVQETRGDWAGAETSYTRSLQVSEDLAERVGGP
ncbi:MAG: tetratricopeptide repeat protein, partial [Actinomycetales bacterium]